MACIKLVKTDCYVIKLYNIFQGENMSAIDVLQDHDILICNGKIMTIQANINPVGDIQIIDW